MIENLFDEYNIKTSKTCIPQFIVEQINDDETIDFLSCMGTRIELHLSDYGVPPTRLYCIDEIVIVNNNEFSDIYIELPFRIKEFLTHALENNDKYIYDGLLAEKFIENLKYD